MAENTDIPCPSGEDACPIFEEVSALKEDVKALQAQVKTDSLTGLNNKLHLISALDTELERTRRTAQPTTILLIDADHFKSVNDTHGHIAGDLVLKNISQVIRNGIRKIDIPCRFGGEEFCIILPSTPSLIGLQVAERIRKNVEGSTTKIDNDTFITVTISVGLATFQLNSKHTRDEFLSLCDQQLYRAKALGRNRVVALEGEPLPETTVSAEEKDALFSTNKPST